MLISSLLSLLDISSACATAHKGQLNDKGEESKSTGNPHEGKHCGTNSSSNVDSSVCFENVLDDDEQDCCDDGGDDNEGSIDKAEHCGEDC